MLKFSFILFIILMTTLVSANAYVKSHEDFVEMTPEQQNQLIIKTMELAVEIESQYRFETAKYGFNNKRYVQYQKMLEKIGSIFVGSAYAAPVKSTRKWDDVATRFQKLRATPTNTQNGYCMFAGWISRTYIGKDGTTFCAHPDFIGGLSANRHDKGMSRETMAYPTPDINSGCGKDDRNKIQCSPLIFGYKNESKQSLFCVPAGEEANNSSFHCMKAALAEPGEAGADKKEVRLMNLRERLKKNPDAFEAMQEFIYQTCICPQSSDKNFSKGYHDKIRPHQTCYGLLEMVAATALDCRENSSPEFPIKDTSIFSNLRKFMASKSITQSSNASETQAAYKEFLEDVKKSSTAEYNRLCKENIEPVIEVSEPPAPPKEGIPPVIPPTSLTPPGAPEETPPAYSCKATCKQEAPKEKDKTPKITCEYDIKNGDVAVDPIDKTAAPSSLLENKITIKVKVDDIEKSVECDVVFPKDKTATPKPTITTSIKEKKEKSYIIEAKAENADGWTLVWSLDKDPNLKVKADWEKRPEAVIAGLASDATTEAATTPEATTPAAAVVESVATTAAEVLAEPPAAAAGQFEISQERVSKDYKVCAKLTKGSEELDGGCQTVDKIVAEEALKPVNPPAAPAGNFNFNNPLPPPPQPIMRPAANSSARGIR